MRVSDKKDMKSFTKSSNNKSRKYLLINIFLLICFSLTSVMANSAEPLEPESTIIAANSGNTTTTDSSTEGAVSTTPDNEEDEILNDSDNTVDDSSTIDDASTKEKDYIVKGKDTTTTDGNWGKVAYTSDQWGWAPENFPAFKKLVAQLKNEEENGVCLIGHTDRFGNKKYNWKLSYRRALIVKNVLVALGLDEARIGIKGVAYKKPVIKWAKKIKDIAKNRRVEIKIVAADVLCGNLKTPPDYIVK